MGTNNNLVAAGVVLILIGIFGFIGLIALCLHVKNMMSTKTIMFFIVFLILFGIGIGLIVMAKDPDRHIENNNNPHSPKFAANNV